MFSGLVFCADCGSKLHFATCKSCESSQDNYRCARYKSNTEDCTTHFIREEVLRKIVVHAPEKIDGIALERGYTAKLKNILPRNRKTFFLPCFSFCLKFNHHLEQISVYI